MGDPVTQDYLRDRIDPDSPYPQLYTVNTWAHGSGLLRDARAYILGDDLHLVDVTALVADLTGRKLNRHGARLLGVGFDVHAALVEDLALELYGPGHHITSQQLN